MRVAIVDVGTNSTRLLIADVDAGAMPPAVTELERRSEVTRLGAGVDASGRLSDEAMARVLTTLGGYDEIIDRTGGVAVRRAVLTSAVRDAANGAQFTARVRDEHGLDARTIPGDVEARLSYMGATSERPADGVVAVLDIGGGSTELIVGEGAQVLFHVSTQAGVVRHSERHIHHDPPLPRELAAVAADVRDVFRAAVPQDLRERARTLIAVAGTATSMAAIDQRLDPFTAGSVHGHRVALASAEAIRDRLAAMTDDERRDVVGLHPARVPTIVAGSILLVEAMRAFGLGEVEVSEHDILHGVALDAAAASSSHAPDS